MIRITVRRIAIVFALFFCDESAVCGFSVVTSTPALTPFGRIIENGGGTRNRPTNTGRCSSTALYVVAKAAATKSGGSSLLVGNLASNLSKLIVGPKRAKAVSAAVSKTVNGKEVALIAFCGWALLPLCRIVYKRRHPEGGDFKNTKRYKVAHLIGQIAQIGGVIYALDVITVVLDVLGFKIPKGLNVCVARLLYLFWAAFRLVKFKKDLLIRKTGKAGAYDKILDAVIAFTTAFSAMDILSVQTGMAMQSVFALGGAGTLIASLGSQNLASQIVNGFAIAATGKYYEGEKVIIDGKIVGTIERMGIVATDMRGEW